MIRWRGFSILQDLCEVKEAVRRGYTLISLNPEVFASFLEIPKLREVREEWLFYVDGVGVQLAMRCSGVSARRIPGVEVVEWVLAEMGDRTFLWGAREEVVKKVAQKYGARLAFNGYEWEAEEVWDKIKRSGCAGGVVCLGTPKQEEAILRLRELGFRGFLLNGGGSFDVLSGEKKRAPLWMRRCGLEWVYRCVSEPRRVGRLVFSLVRFARGVFVEKK